MEREDHTTPSSTCDVEGDTAEWKDQDWTYIYYWALYPKWFQGNMSHIYVPQGKSLYESYFAPPGNTCK